MRVIPLSLVRGGRAAQVRPPRTGAPGLAFETWDTAMLAIEQTLNVTGSMNDVNDLNSVASRLIEDQPVLEAFHRPATNAAKGWLAEGAQYAEPRHFCQCLKCVLCCIQKALSSLHASMLFEILGVRQDIPASTGTDKDVRQLTSPGSYDAPWTACPVHRGAWPRIQEWPPADHLRAAIPAKSAQAAL